MRDYNYFLEHVWTEVVERLGLDECAEPTAEEYELWQSVQADAGDYHVPDFND